MPSALRDACAALAGRPHLGHDPLTAAAAPGGGAAAAPGGGAAAAPGGGAAAIAREGTISQRNESLLVLGALAAAIALSFVPGGQYVLYPFEVLGTWIHEMSHGVTAAIVGFEFDRLTIDSDTSGLAYYLMPSGANFRRGLVASAGYLGTTFWGCCFLMARRFRVAGRAFLIAFGTAMALSLIFYVRNGFGIAATAVWAAAFLALGIRMGSRVAEIFTTFTGGFVAVQAVRSIRVLFQVEGGSDAVTMSEVWLLPYWFWAGLWMAISVAAVAVCLWIVLRPRPEGSGAKAKAA